MRHRQRPTRISAPTLPLTTAILGVSALTATSHAQTDSTTPPEPAPVPAPADEALAPAPAPSKADSFHIAISPYAWLTSYSGNTTIRDVEYDATMSFVDILEESDKVFGLMGALDLEYKRFVFQFNGSWSTAQLDDRGGVASGGAVSADLEMDLAWYELLGGYRFLDRPIGKTPESARRLTLDGFIGGRVTMLELDATVTANAPLTLPDGSVLNPGESLEQSASENWFEPFLGARLGLDLSEHWALQFRGDIGGFGLSGAEFAWQTAALVGYRWRLDGWDFALFGGYRALGQDYSSGSFGWDVITHGPLLGMQFSFAF